METPTFNKFYPLDARKSVLHAWWRKKHLSWVKRLTIYPPKVDPWVAPSNTWFGSQLNLWTHQLPANSITLLHSPSIFFSFSSIKCNNNLFLCDINGKKIILMSQDIKYSVIYSVRCTKLQSESFYFVYGHWKITHMSSLILVRYRNADRSSCGNTWKIPPVKIYPREKTYRYRARRKKEI